MKKKKPPVEFPEEIKALELAEIFGTTDRRIQQLAEEGVIPKLKDGGYPCKESLKALYAYLRERAEGQPAQTAADRGRQARADADSAEMDAAKKAGLLMLTADAKRIWASGFVQIRDLISRCRELKPKVKSELSAKLLKIRLEEPEKE